MNGKPFMRWRLVCRTLWQNDHIRVIAIVMTCLVSVFSTAALAETQITSDPFADDELAAVLLVQDKGRDVERKLGAPCVLQASNRETSTLVYRAADGTFLRFVVNVSPSDVNYQLIESMTMSVQPTIPMTCYTASHASVNGKLSRVHTARGIQLGSLLDQILELYGEPNETQIVNPQEVRLQYNLGYETDRYYQWTLTFRDGRLVDWTAEAIPFFTEVGG